MFYGAESFDQCLEWSIDGTDDDAYMFYDSPGKLGDPWTCA